MYIETAYSAVMDAILSINSHWQLIRRFGRLSDHRLSDRPWTGAFTPENALVASLKATNESIYGIFALVGRHNLEESTVGR